jgi:hypothetical protein
MQDPAKGFPGTPQLVEKVRVVSIEGRVEW